VQPAMASDANNRGTDSDDNYKDNEDSDGSESPRPAKRHQSSPSNSYPISKRTCKHRLQSSYKRYTALVQTQPEQSPSILPGDHLQSKMAPNPTSAGDEELTSNVSAGIAYVQSLQTSDRWR
jgi:hypothetical protein